MQRHDLPRHTGAAFTLLISMTLLWGSVPQLAFADSHSSATPLGYESALTGYKSMDGSEPTAWKKSNEAVGEIGGWRAYANEAYQANKAEANAASAGEATVEQGAEDMEPAVTTPLPNVSATRLDPAANARVSSDESSMNDQSKMHAAEQPSSPPVTLSYQSALSNYRLYDDNPPGDWRSANERVGEIGGWRTYAKEAYEASKRKMQMDDISGDSQ